MGTFTRTADQHRRVRKLDPPLFSTRRDDRSWEARPTVARRTVPARAVTRRQRSVRYQVLMVAFVMIVHDILTDRASRAALAERDQSRRRPRSCAFRARFSSRRKWMTLHCSYSSHPRNATRRATQFSDTTRPKWSHSRRWAREQAWGVRGSSSQLSVPYGPTTSVRITASGPSVAHSGPLRHWLSVVTVTGPAGVDSLPAPSIAVTA